MTVQAQLKASRKFEAYLNDHQRNIADAGEQKSNIVQASNTAEIKGTKRCSIANTDSQEETNALAICLEAASRVSLAMRL